MHADVGLRETIIELFKCYDPAWLKLGIETVMGEVLTSKSASTLPQLLRKFMLEVRVDLVYFVLNVYIRMLYWCFLQTAVWREC